jgi:hypothetical protein
MIVRITLVAALAGLAGACATTSTGSQTVAAPSVSRSAPVGPQCRDAVAYERAVFGAIVAHNSSGAADMMVNTDQSRRLRSRDTAVMAQVFGSSMSEPSLRSVLLQPPLCLYDQTISDGQRMTYVFPRGRFAELQDPAIPGAELGLAAVDHIACRFAVQGGQWLVEDACLSTFAPQPPVGS